ncbi:uncharacterized protein LOC122037236 isoform X1 [Zingiber officinale]|uniref:uncharacterized protein LOC122037236 isoform X1 n=2 Tax=Zingiber officinale TaxID=94328 RepID=UPI001C4CB879|nr:uncharacterized protein LOC122037236 isoform X1 [Zingiber officinale]
MDFQGLGSSWSSFDAAMVGEEESQVMAQLFGSQEMFCFDHSSHCDLFDWNQGSYDGTSSASVLPHVAANYAEDNYLIKNGGPASTFTNQEEKVEWQGWRRCLEVPKKKGSKKGKNSLSKRTEKSDDNVNIGVQEVERKTQLARRTTRERVDELGASEG